MFPIVLVVAALCGVGVGLLIARRTTYRTHPNAAATNERQTTQEQHDNALARGLRSAVDRLEIGVVMCDASSRITYQNLAANAMNGTHAGIIVDDHLRQIFRATRGGDPLSRVIRLQGPPKVTYSIEALALPNGGAVATIEDISERVRIEAMRTDFVANISHELKTPVGAIAVLAEMLVDEPEPTVIADLATRIVEESHRAVRTIDDLLELSRIESSRSVDDIVSLGDLIDEAVARGRIVAAGRDVSVAAIALPHPIRIKADRAQLASALGNLVENAVKYSNGGDSVQVRTLVGERWVELMVADQGVGIPGRDLDRVFERFYRVDKARARGTGGTGLGLAIVRHVMNNHGGDVSVSSEEGEGSTFVLRFPIRLLVDAAPEPNELTDAGTQHHEDEPA